MRAKGLDKLFSRKHIVFAFKGIWRKVFGTPERSGIWLIYGKEKNGKTWFCLKLAEYLSQFEKVLYVSAEEGFGLAFVEACKRAKLDPKNKNLKFLEYTPIEEIKPKLKSERGYRVVFIDNITVYKDELKYGVLRKLADEFKNVLFVYIAHEEKGEPYTATAKLAKKLAHIFCVVEGLATTIAGRCPGGVLTIDEEKAQLYHGTKITENNEQK